jgi:inosine/xanthosine triphosphate pyrophosphatase family protein
MENKEPYSCLRRVGGNTDNVTVDDSQTYVTALSGRPEPEAAIFYKCAVEAFDASRQL